jgi:hypothetical protein
MWGLLHVTQHNVSTTGVTLCSLRIKSKFLFRRILIRTINQLIFVKKAQCSFVRCRLKFESLFRRISSLNRLKELKLRILSPRVNYTD